MIISVRLDQEEQRLVGRLARSMKMSRSDVIRAAIEALAEREHVDETSSPYDRIAHLIGCVKGGPTDLSERTGDRFREALAKKAHR